MVGMLLFVTVLSQVLSLFPRETDTVTLKPSINYFVRFGHCVLPELTLNRSRFDRNQVLSYNHRKYGRQFGIWGKLSDKLNALWQ